jgi:ribosomal protein S18 acetylase RimI-like enzyme
MYEIRRASQEDVALVVSNIRASDVADIQAVSPLPPAEAVLHSFNASQRRLAFLAHGRCVGIGGIQFDDDQGNGSIWLIGTPEFDTYMSRGAARHSRAALAMITKNARTLYNFVDETNQATLRWLEWMGFDLVARHPNFRELGRTCVEVRYRVHP